MPYAVNDGVRIHYTVDGDGPPLLLHWGFAGSIEDWEDPGYVAALRDRYRVIRLDPRGQGRSDRPHDPAAYARDLRVGDVLAVLDAAGIDRTHYWGYSMGGWIGFVLGAAAPHRLRSLVLGGAQPFEGNPRPLGEDAWLSMVQQGMAELVRLCEMESADWWQSPGERERWLAADAEALAAARTQWLSEPDLSKDVVSAIPVPALLFAGTRDQPEAVQRTARLMPHATFVALEDLDHAGAIARSDLVLPHVLAFLEHIDTTSAVRSEPGS